MIRADGQPRTFVPFCPIMDVCKKVPTVRGGSARGLVRFITSTPQIPEVQIHVGVSLAHSQVSRPEQPGARPTSTDKLLFFFVLFSSSGLGLLPADNDKGHTCRINDWTALPPSLARALLF